MNNHQSLKCEVDTRDDNFTSCISLAKELLSTNHYASTEVSKLYCLPVFIICDIWLPGTNLNIVA